MIESPGAIPVSFLGISENGWKKTFLYFDGGIFLNDDEKV